MISFMYLYLMLMFTIRTVSVIVIMFYYNVTFLSEWNYGKLHKAF